MLNCIIKQMHVLCLSFFHRFLVGSLPIMQWLSCSDGKKKKVKTTCQIAIELTSTVHILENQASRTVPTKYGGFWAKLAPCGKSRSLQKLLESKKKNECSHAFCKIISLESQQRCWQQHFSEKRKQYFFTNFLRIRLNIQKSKHIYKDLKTTCKWKTVVRLF